MTGLEKITISYEMNSQHMCYYMYDEYVTVHGSWTLVARYEVATFLSVGYKSLFSWVLVHLIINTVHDWSKMNENLTNE